MTKAQMIAKLAERYSTTVSSVWLQKDANGHSIHIYKGQKLLFSLWSAGTEREVLEEALGSIDDASSDAASDAITAKYDTYAENVARILSEHGAKDPTGLVNLNEYKPTIEVGRRRKVPPEHVAAAIEFHEKIMGRWPANGSVTKRGSGHDGITSEQFAKTAREEPITNLGSTFPDWIHWICEVRKGIIDNGGYGGKGLDNFLRSHKSWLESQWKLGVSSDDVGSKIYVTYPSIAGYSGPRIEVMEDQPSDEEYGGVGAEVTSYMDDARDRSKARKSRSSSSRRVGTSRTHKTCDNCGKTDLKSTVVMESADGAKMYYGSECAKTSRDSASFFASARFSECLGHTVVDKLIDDGFLQHGEGNDWVIKDPTFFTRGKYAKVLVDSLSSCSQSQRVRAVELGKEHKREAENEAARKANAERMAAAIPEERELWKELDKLPLDWAMPHPDDKSPTAVYQRQRYDAEVDRIKKRIVKLQEAVNAKRGKVTVIQSDGRTLWAARSKPLKKDKADRSERTKETIHTYPVGSDLGWCVKSVTQEIKKHPKLSPDVTYRHIEWLLSDYGHDKILQECRSGSTPKETAKRIVESYWLYSDKARERQKKPKCVERWRRRFGLTKNEALHMCETLGMPLSRHKKRKKKAA